VSGSITHVLHFSEKPNRNPIGGAEAHVLTLVEELAVTQAEVELLVLMWNEGPIVSSALDSAAARGVRIEIIRCPTTLALPGSRYAKAMIAGWRLFRALRQRRERLIHLHLDLIAAVVCARIAGCSRLVLSIHNDEQHYSRSLWRWWLRVIDRWIKAYIAITAHVKSFYVHQSGVSQAKVSVVHYGVRPLADASLPREQLGVPADRFLIGFIGRLTQQKNIPLLLQAMTLLPEAYCVIIGEGEDRAKLERLAQSLGLKNVRFAGAVPNAQRYMHAFDVLCLPSLWEGLGLVLVEAMQQRTPIVASRAGAIPEVLNNGRCGVLFDPQSPESLVEAVLSVQRDPEQTKQMTLRAFKFASEMFSVTAMVSKTLAVYRTALS
jgi:glycosyltransferase involved in cell wall biosynthesis